MAGHEQFGCSTSHFIGGSLLSGIGNIGGFGYFYPNCWILFEHRHVTQVDISMHIKCSVNRVTSRSFANFAILLVSIVLFLAGIHRPTIKLFHYLLDS